MKAEDFLKICNIEVTKLDRKIVIDQSRLIALLDKHKEAINYTHSCTELKAFKDEFIEAWEDGSGGDSDLYRKAKSL